MKRANMGLKTELSEVKNYIKVQFRNNDDL